MSKQYLGFDVRKKKVTPTRECGCLSENIVCEVKFDVKEMQLFSPSFKRIRENCLLTTTTTCYLLAVLSDDDECHMCLLHVFYLKLFDSLF